MTQRDIDTLAVRYTEQQQIIKCNKIIKIDSICSETLALAELAVNKFDTDINIWAAQLARDISKATD